VTGAEHDQLRIEREDRLEVGGGELREALGLPLRDQRIGGDDAAAAHAVLADAHLAVRVAADQIGRESGFEGELHGRTILPVHEAVIVIADLYLQSGEPPGGQPADLGAAAGLEFAGRFGERERLAGGWRQWLALWLGRADLAGVSVAGVAAAALAGAAQQRAGGAAAAEGAGAVTHWIATPLELVAGLTRVHLDRRGIVRLAAEEQATLVESFHCAFAGSGLTLQPLSDGQLLLTTAGIAALATTEPARWAGGELEVPHGPAAASLLRLVAEIEMWLHGAPLNEARVARGAPRVTTLWLWGAQGAAAAPGRAPRAPRANGGVREVAFGSDAFLAGLCHLTGAALQPLPEHPHALFAQQRAERAVLVAELARESPAAGPWRLAAATDMLDRRLIQPALAALRSGLLERLSLIANDIRVTLGPRSGWKRWRRPRAGLAGFA